MVPQYSARYIARHDLELITFEAVYVTDNLAVEFWADVYDHESEETVIVTGRYCEFFGELETVWLDYEALQVGHPLRKVVEQDRELRAACERAHQHARFQALEALL